MRSTVPALPQTPVLGRSSPGRSLPAGRLSQPELSSEPAVSQPHRSPGPTMRRRGNGDSTGVPN
eukprot:1006171-Alexandrium_andersonii.AAC.1